MRKIIRQYFCDHCGKEVKEKSEDISPLDFVNIRIDDVNKSGFYLNATIQLCSDCHRKLEDDIKSMVSILTNNWITKEEEET